MEEAVYAIAVVLLSLLGVTASVSFATNLFMGGSLNTLLSAIKNIQIISHLPLLSIFVPANA